MRRPNIERDGGVKAAWSLGPSNLPGVDPPSRATVFFIHLESMAYHGHTLSLKQGLVQISILQERGLNSA